MPRTSLVDSDKAKAAVSILIRVQITKEEAVLSVFASLGGKKMNIFN
jgi:hypothetical protein